MANNKKVLTTDNLVTLKEILDATYQLKGESSGESSTAIIDESSFKTINGQSIVGTGNLKIESAAQIAPAFVSDTHYIVGQIVSKNQKIYACIEEHDAESFDSSKWIETNVMEDLETYCVNKFNELWDNEVSSLLDQEL